MAIRLTEDLGAPLAVTAIDLITESYAPDWNKWASYIVAGGSYVGAWMGWGGPFVKNMGIASFPWAAKNIYEAIKGGVGSRAGRLSFRKAGVSRYPAPAFATEFKGATLT